MNASSTNCAPTGFFGRVSEQVLVNGVIGVGSFVLGTIAMKYKDTVLRWCGWSRIPQTANLFKSRIKTLRAVYARGTRLADSIMERVNEGDPIGPEDGINFVIGINSMIAALEKHADFILEHHRSVVGGRQYEELSHTEEAALLLVLDEVDELIGRLTDIRQNNLGTFNVHNFYQKYKNYNFC